jgi:hypothetical protein
VLAFHTLTRAENYGDDAAIARHLEDFPYDAAGFTTSGSNSAATSEAAAEIASVRAK